MAYWEAVGAMHRLELLRRFKARELMADSGLHPGQPRLLEYVRSHPGCTQKEAADELDVTPASIAASLKRLEKAGYVTRTQDDKDARCNQLYLTGAGIERMEEHRRQFGALDEKMFSGMTEAEVSAFRSACEKMFDNLADEGDRRLTIWKLARKAQEEEEGENT